MTQVCLYVRMSRSNKTAQSHPLMPAHPRPHRHDCAIATETPPRRDTHIVLVLLVLGLLLRLVRLDFLGSLASGVLDLLHSVCGSAHRATLIQPSYMCPSTTFRASIHPPARFDAHVPCIEAFLSTTAQAACVRLLGLYAHCGRPRCTRADRVNSHCLAF